MSRVVMQEDLLKSRPNHPVEVTSGVYNTRTTVEEAKVTSERALLQAALLKEEQQKTTAQVS